ncbi:MAG TPA: aldo/keto reductase [Pyrinomonadaceae bacterium]|nr:aldo/keto reductase [Pyrinomonadaceae bacterium]
MEKRVLGRTDMGVSVLGFGGSEIGYGGASVETVERLLGGALDAGLNVIDTAECYVTSEELIGRAVSHRREDYYLFTKCGHASGIDLPDWDARLLEQSIERSLRRLRTDYVDLLQLHSCSEEVLRRGDVIEVLRRAREAGQTRYIGYSGDGRAAFYAVECGAFDTLQTSVNIADQESVTLTLPAARARGLGIIAKRPIANAVWKHDARPGDSYVQPYWDRLRELDYEFLRGDMAEAVSVALRFTLGVPGVATAIVGTERPERWQENAAMLRAGALDAGAFDMIRTRWAERAGADWAGEV